MAGYLPAKRHCKHASGTLGADELRFEGEETPFACGKKGFLPPQTPPSSPKPAFYSTRSFLRRSGHALRLPFGLCRRERAQPFRRRGVLVVFPPRPLNPSPARFYRDSVALLGRWRFPFVARLPEESFCVFGDRPAFLSLSFRFRQRADKIFRVCHL